MENCCLLGKFQSSFLVELSDLISWLTRQTGEYVTMAVIEHALCARLSSERLVCRHASLSLRICAGCTPTAPVSQMRKLRPRE